MTNEKMFHVEELSLSIREEMIFKGTWKPECPVPLDRLRLVTFAYIDFESQEHRDGELVVMDVVAANVAKIFEELHALKFPISSAKRIEHYNGSDDASMDDNNSSAFNYRVISGTKTVSIHGYGLAIDVNPVQNPMVFRPTPHPDKSCMQVEVWPGAGAQFLSRARQEPGMVEPIVGIFAKYGFRDWGGQWKDMWDIHHFQTPRWLAEILAAEKPSRAQELFDYYVQHPEVTAEEILRI